MNALDVFLSAGVTIFSLSLLVIALLSYQRYKNTKLVFIIGILLVFLVKGVLFSLSLVAPQIRAVVFSSSFWCLDLVILVLLYFTSLKR